MIRYRLGDVVTGTRFLSQADNAVPLPCEREETPRIPLISIAFRSGNLLNVTGENTTEQHIMDALQKTMEQWKQQKIHVDMCDFTLYAKLDAFPVRYVIFLELLEDKSEKERTLIDYQCEILQNDLLAEIERQLCQSNHIYRDNRKAGRLAPLKSVLVRRGTFSVFLNKILVTDRVSPIQVKPHRLLKNEQHIKFFYDNQIDTNSFS